MKKKMAVVYYKNGELRRFTVFAASHLEAAQRVSYLMFVGNPDWDRICRVLDGTQVKIFQCGPYPEQVFEGRPWYELFEDDD